jgi:hypothetical protein
MYRITFLTKRIKRMIIHTFFADLLSNIIDITIVF